MLTVSDLMDTLSYEKVRPQKINDIMELKKKRRLWIGPVATVLFENRETILHQIHEMLFIERHSNPNPLEELAAYAPMVPGAKKFVATLMFEITDKVRRLEFLQTLSHVEETIVLACGSYEIKAAPIGNEDRTRDYDGKTSAVHFLTFDCTQIPNDLLLEAPLLFKIQHPDYCHSTVVPHHVQHTVTLSA